MSHSPHFFFFNDTATTEIYTLSLHDALPILQRGRLRDAPGQDELLQRGDLCLVAIDRVRSEEHTSELQSRPHLVCRLLLEKKTHTTFALYRLMLRILITTHRLSDSVRRLTLV